MEGIFEARLRRVPSTRHIGQAGYYKGCIPQGGSRAVLKHVQHYLMQVADFQPSKGLEDIVVRRFVALHSLSQRLSVSFVESAPDWVIVAARGELVFEILLFAVKHRLRLCECGPRDVALPLEQPVQHHGHLSHHGFRGVFEILNTSSTMPFLSGHGIQACICCDVGASEQGQARIVKRRVEKEPGQVRHEFLTVNLGSALTGCGSLVVCGLRLLVAWRRRSFVWQVINGEHRILEHDCLCSVDNVWYVLGMLRKVGGVAHTISHPRDRFAVHVRIVAVIVLIFFPAGEVMILETLQKITFVAGELELERSQLFFELLQTAQIQRN